MQKNVILLKEIGIINKLNILIMGNNVVYSELGEQVAKNVADFARKHIIPFYKEWDELEVFPRELFKKMGELGFMGMLIPEKYGGASMGYYEYVSMLIELAKVCSGVALSVAAHNSLCTQHIYQFGTEEQRAKYLPQLTNGDWIGAWALTEPTTGSDASNMKTVATKIGDKWEINGTKCWITHGKSSEVAVVLCRTAEPRTANNVTAFIVERNTPGLKAGKKEHKLGVRASETAEMIFEHCVVSDTQRLGQIGTGFHQAMKILEGGRISIAALSVGCAKGAYECALNYAKERAQFDQLIGNFQAISFKLADMVLKINGSELLILQSCNSKIKQSNNINLHSAMAKYFASETAVYVSNEAMQILGGNGYSKEYPVEKYLRDARITTIGEGTSEIQKLVISREILQ
ncbi:MAG: acyl-CoA dehydrogenase family protein [Phycisphaerales bacterium]|nr:acyl-CoA dehydrogenase family protein [Phycisphaerales bacterium]